MSQQLAQQGAGLRQPLNPEELAVLQLLARGHSVKRIVHDLNSTPYSVQARIRRSCAKLGVATRQEAILRARDLRLLGA